MADDNLPNPNPEPAPAPQPAPARSRLIVCEYCECRLTPEGQIMGRGDKAKAFMRLEDQIENLKRENEQLQAKLAAVEAEAAALRAPQRERFQIPI